MTPPLNTNPNRTPSPLRTPLIVGVGVAAVGVILFILIYGLMSAAAPAPRLFTALCVPPAVIAVGIGMYVLLVRSGKSS